MRIAWRIKSVKSEGRHYYDVSRSCSLLFAVFAYGYFSVKNEKKLGKLMQMGAHLILPLFDRCAYSSGKAEIR